MRRYFYHPRKDHTNQQKHRVSFSEAESAFDDAHALIFFDVEHSIDEDRWIVIGMSERERLLFVVHTHIADDTIRIISARRANFAEEQMYAQSL